MASPALLLYLTAVHHSWRSVRVCCMGLVFHLMLLRSLALFKRELGVLLVGGVLLCCWTNCSLLLPAAGMLLLVQLWCWLQAALRIEHISGHRAGAEGFTGPLCENTTEAMLALVEADNGPQGPLHDLHYVEVDILETSDGELLVFHDTGLGRAFPAVGPNVSAYHQLQQQGHGPSALVQDLTTAQLRSLHIAGRPGLHAPTLREFLDAFRAAGCRRPMVIEIKALRTDKGRQQLLDLCREHKPYADKLAAQLPHFCHPQLGFLAVICFPHYFAASFGEFGSASAKYWSRRLLDVGVGVRCCFLEQLSYCHGL